ncbi:DUF4188 domain-containing protein [Kytococcus sedentarius]|uniref:DUF4188 domain-containing protein n=1 Tax=Kytococcus sedentarius TaxID=1276 RepID=UPI0035BC0794
MLTRHTHAHEGGLVVFHIGMTIQRPHRPDLWMPVFLAMPPMLTELHRNRDAAARGEAEDLGFLGASTLLGGKGPWVVQYWRTVDHLYAYAKNQDLAHVPAWRRFNQAARRHPGAVGIWHETYVVPEGGVETFYGNGASVGLAEATGMVDAGSGTGDARQRLSARPRGNAACRPRAMRYTHNGQPKTSTWTSGETSVSPAPNSRI